MGHITQRPCRKAQASPNSRLTIAVQRSVGKRHKQRVFRIAGKVGLKSRIERLLLVLRGGQSLLKEKVPRRLKSARGNENKRLSRRPKGRLFHRFAFLRSLQNHAVQKPAAYTTSILALARNCLAKFDRNCSYFCFCKSVFNCTCTSVKLCLWAGVRAFRRTIV